MNKQQLANKIWATAQKMRSSKIEAQQYKDYLLGFIFYKFLSAHEVNFLKKELDFTDDDFKNPAPSLFDKDTVDYCKNNIGYFIHPKHLYATWLAKSSAFSVKDVSQALSAFRRNINPTYNHVYKDIFKTLDSGFSDFGETTGSMTKAISELLNLIKDIPTDGRQDYDVLGFIYEYLIGKFAASAGKKAGEYYTPHEVSELMSEIVAEHLKDREYISIYDPTSGSGSLLLTIGRAVAKHMKGNDNVDYYAQEWIDSTYNLTRMNLVMRGAKPNQINVRNADTLAADWPLEKNKRKPLRVDAVVSNPPYSQGWDANAMKDNPRFTYGLAPKGKADYAFLLHSLYHLENDGIMTIVLPTGVLSRGEEHDIRRNLIEHGHIKTVIALPPNIFYGTNIPTIIMVLCQKRREGEADDVLFVDASNCFTKQGTKNVLRASDIKRIADAVRDRKYIPHFATLVSKKTVAEDNDYNLHIPRYVKTVDQTEPQDLYAHIYGGIPNAEINEMNDYWEAFPSLRQQLFESSGDTPYSSVAAVDVSECVAENQEVNAFRSSYQKAFDGLDSQLNGVLIDHMTNINTDAELSRLTNNIFERIKPFSLIDPYEIYQTLSDHWTGIATDIEIIQTEGFSAARQVDEVVEVKVDKNGKEDVKHKGWAGHVVPFLLVQQHLLKDESQKLQNLAREQEETVIALSEMKDELTPEEQDRYLTEDRDGFEMTRVEEDYQAALDDISTPEVNTVKAYIKLLDDGCSKPDKLAFIEGHSDFDWTQMPANREGTYNKGDARDLLWRLQYHHQFDEDTTAYKLSRISHLASCQKGLERDIKYQTYLLEQHTIDTIKSLTDSQVIDLLRMKWIEPLCHDLTQAPDAILLRIIQRVETLEKKYADTLHQINVEIADAESALADMLARLQGDQYDMAAIRELQAMMKNEKTGDSAQLLKEVCAKAMLPEEGNREPRVRFKGYQGEWIQEIGTNLFSASNDRNHPDLPVLAATQDRGMVIRDDIGFKVSHDKQNEVGYKRVLPGDFVIHLRSFQGGFAHSAFEGIASPAYSIFSLRKKEEHDDKFWKFVFTSKAFVNKLQLITYGIRDGRNIRYDEFVKLENIFPQKDEQHDIATFFTTLDRLISLRARQLEKLKSLKSGCLQKMFV